jgi:hypothetical protein
MAVDPSIRIDIAAEFTGKKAFDKASKSTSSLEKSVKNAAKALTGLFAAQKILAFGKASAKAFMADEAAANRLSTAVKNLGLGFEDARIKNFVSTIEAQTGVLDDKLRPALQSLLTTTGSVSKSQELLKLAIDVAAGSGEDLAVVADDISKAYVGTTKGLEKYKLGLTKAELASASFNDIQTALNKQFAGSNAAYLDTYAGKMDVLGVSFANMQETIGKGLLDSFALLAGDGGIGAATSAMDAFAQKTSDAIYGVATLLDKLNTKFGTFGGRSIGEILYAIGGGGFIDALAKIGSDAKLKPKPFSTPMTISGQSDTSSQAAKQRAAAEAAAAKRAKELAALQNKSAAAAAKQLAAEKARLLLEKAKVSLSQASAAFDLNKIQIAAALKATYDKDETLRLLAMQAIENDNGAAALEYIKQLNLLTAEQQTNKLNGIKSIAESELSSINGILLAELDRISKTKMTDEEAAAARAEAYRKYNAAIIASGGLAEANFYSEKTQSELLTIAKLAAISKVAEAQATLDILNYTTQTDIIARVAAAQKIADDAKYKALQDYLALLATPFNPPVIGGVQINPPVIGGVQKPDFGVGGQPLHSGDYWDGSYNTGLGSGMASGSVDNSITVVVQGSVLDGNDFDDKVNQAMINAMRKGYSQYPAGSLP